MSGDHGAGSASTDGREVGARNVVGQASASMAGGEVGARNVVGLRFASTDGREVCAPNVPIKQSHGQYARYV